MFTDVPYERVSTRDCHLSQFLADLPRLKMIVAGSRVLADPGTEHLHEISHDPRHHFVQPLRTSYGAGNVRSELTSGGPIP